MNHLPQIITNLSDNDAYKVSMSHSELVLGF